MANAPIPPEPEPTIRTPDVLDAVRSLAWDLEEGLRAMAFDEVTLEDRVTFVECVRDKHVGRAIARRRFDAAVAVRDCADQRIAALKGARGQPGLRGRAI